MKRALIFVLSFLGATSIIKGQIAKWVIPPVYDNIWMATGESLIVTDSLNQRIFWSPSGKRLFMTADYIAPFKDGLAVTTKPKTSFITGFYNKYGQFKSLTGCQVTYSMPYFSYHHLLVYHGGFYKFVNSNGEIESGQYANAYPFSNGYASCVAYSNPLRRKNPYSLLLSQDHKDVTFSYGGKQFDNDDLEFVSSVNDEGIGIVVAKHKLYYFNGEDRSISPIYAKEGETNKKNQARLEEDISSSFFDLDSVFVLQAISGKEHFIQIKLDRLMVPLSISLADGERVYKKKDKQETTYNSPLKVVTDSVQLGLYWGEDEILPPQFDKIRPVFEDMAFVSISDKCGSLKVFKDEEFKISINKGDPVGFKHQKYETTVRMDLPKMVSAYNTNIQIDPESGCEVDMPSCERKDTEFGNYIQYDCVLNIPDSLPDEMNDDERNEIIYPSQVIYDGLKSPIIPLKVKAWHYKYFNIDVIDSETSLHQGTFSFSFVINADRNSNDAVYPTSVTIQTDSLQFELEKITETRYKCKIMDLKEGMNNVVVLVQEEGCPPVSFPYEVIYTKPTAQTRNEPVVKINKKPKSPYLKI